ncbi:DMT family transporter [Labrys monachus]|uniref:Drug/metabolite transporter (DMT)-like permease n=1 Tax=Labrys monachus TaxID=217067 RepID=A0ABU0FNU4_9HYPH|nr:DMT family transporter [Labrys monachus]MDQ0396277.1 drug/metabolite transporter (DMT)-like permease [Labrys monachus]
MNGNAILPGLGLGLLAAVSYGSNVPFAKLSAEAGVSGPNVVFYRSLLMVALLGLFALSRRAPLAVPQGVRLPVLGLGVATSFVGICYISSVAFIPVGVATIIYYLYPLVILVVSPWVDSERLTPARLMIFALAFLGLVVAIGPAFTSLDPRGLVLAMLGSAAAAAQFFFAARATRAIGPVAAGFWAQAIQMPAALGICLLAGGPVAPAALAGAAWPVGMTCALFILAFALHLASARMAPPAALGLVFCAEPVASILLAARLLGETLAPAQLAGGCLVLLAIVGSVVVESRRPALGT